MADIKHTKNTTYYEIETVDFFKVSFQGLLYKGQLMLKNRERHTSCITNDRKMLGFHKLIAFTVMYTSAY